MYLVLIFLTGLFLGFTIFYVILEVTKKINLIKLKKQYNDAFSEIESLIGTKSFKFVSRFNDYLTFKAHGATLGKVTIVTIPKKGEVSIFRDETIIFTQHYADSGLIKSLINNINITYDNQIKDCYKVMGNIIDKATIKKMNPDVEFPEAFPKITQRTFTMDDILDRINEVGLNNLTKEEKDFLNNYQKK